MYHRLSLLMFLQFAIPGAWWPLFVLRLEKELHFTPVETSWAFAGASLAAILAPILAGQVADRWLSADRCIAISAGCAGIFLWLLAESTSPLLVCLLCTGVWLALIPISTLGVTLSLANLHNPELQFGRIRMWGTIGWVAFGLLIGYWLSEPVWLEPVLTWLGRTENTVADSLRLAGTMAFFLSAYALTLPNTPPARMARSWLAPMQALHLLRDRSFAIFVLCSFGLYITLPFTIQLTPLLLESIGVPLKWIGPTLTICQSMEMASLWLLPILSLRLNLKQMLLTGLLAWTTAMIILCLGQPPWLVICSLSLNGLCVCFYMIRGQVFINRQAEKEIRASAQGLATMINGAGLLLGNLLVGGVRELFHGQFMPTFAVAVAIAGTACIVFIFGFQVRLKSTAPSLPVTYPVDQRSPLVETLIVQVPKHAQSA